MVSVITLPLVVTRSWDELVDTRLQTSLLRALAPTTPTYVFPAMNTLMYEHPLTSQHVRIIKEVIGYQVVGPVGKSLACGDVGKVNFAKTCTRSYVRTGLGAMSEWTDIVQIVVDKFNLTQ